MSFTFSGQYTAVRMKPEYFNSLNYQFDIEDMNIQQMRNKLAQIPMAKRGELRTKLVPWIYTNDLGFGDNLDVIQKGIRQQKRNGKPRVGIISGVGAILTVTPYLDIDCLVSIDRNSFVLDQVFKMVDTIRQSESKEEYQELAQLEEFFGLMKLEQVDAESYYNVERNSFGERHFLASDESYQKSRTALNAAKVLFSQGNFTYRPYVQELGNALSEGEVVYANFTDLGEWYPEFFSVISDFPLSEDAVINWSTNKTQEGTPQSMVSTGLQEYLTQAQQSMEELDVSYFKQHV